MESPNINQSKETVPPKSITPKKWYGHKGIFSAIVLAIIATVIIFLYFNQQSTRNNKILDSTNQGISVSLQQCTNESTDKQGDCFRKYGETTKDINTCKAIAVYPNDVSCAIGVAMALNDIKICDQVSDFLSYEAPQYGVQACYIGYAAANKDTKICASLYASSTQQTQFEQDTCYTGIATDSLDDSYCSYLSDTYSKDQCYMSVGEAKLDITVCDKISTGNNEFKGACYLEIAKTNKDSSLCDKMAFYPNLQTACYQNFQPETSSTTMISSTDTTTCSRPNDPTAEWMCLAKLAESTSNTAGCEQGSTQDVKDSCYIKLVEDNGNINLCDKVELSNNKDSCYYSAAPFTLDSTVCDKIAAAGLEKGCLQNLYSLVTFNLNTLEATTSPGQSVEFTGNIKNNSHANLYLNGLSANLGYSELTEDSSPFFKLPPMLKPGESTSGELFSIAASQVALTGDYEASFQLQGGNTQNSSGILGDQTLEIHITK